MKTYQHLLFTSVVAIALTGPAQAQPTSGVSEYRNLVAKGAEFFGQKRYGEARRKFTRAYAIHKDPQLLFNIASTYRREGNAERAVDYYKRFLRAAPTEHPRRQLAHATIAELRAPTIAIKPKPLPSPKPQPALVLVKQPARAPGRTLRWSGIAMFTAGAIGLGVSLRQGLRARSISAELSELPMGTVWTDEQKARHGQGEAAETAAVVWSIVGGAAALAGIVAYYLGRERDRRATTRRVRLIPRANDGGVAFVVAGRF